MNLTYVLLFDTARVKCRAGSIKRSSRLSVDLSVSQSHSQQSWPAGFLLSALQAGDIDRQRRTLEPRTSCRRARQQHVRLSTALDQRQMHAIHTC